MARLRPVLLGVAATALVAAACGGGTHSSAAAPASSPAATAAATGKVVHVMIHNFAFSPATLTVHAGQTVEWTNEDSVTHTVTSTSSPKVFNSGDLAPGKTFSYTFTAAGSYPYFCEIHQYMTASVTVVG